MKTLIGHYLQALHHISRDQLANQGYLSPQQLLSELRESTSHGESANEKPASAGRHRASAADAGRRKTGQAATCCA